MSHSNEKLDHVEQPISSLKYIQDNTKIEKVKILYGHLPPFVHRLYFLIYMILF